ncbi:DUF975 family protein [Lactococcus petauri]|uniref:DUF975 family protein n=1 Tax=Lactococcus petauri TaxID=1940789 RepID=UPI003BF9A5AD
MQSIKELKYQARINLQGHWKEAILLNLIPTLFKIVPNLIYITILLSLFTSTDLSKAINSFDNLHNNFELFGGFVSTLLMTGISWTYLDLIRGTKTNIKPFKDAFRGLSKLFITGVLLMTFLLITFTTLWTLVFIIPGIIKALSYSQSYFIYYDTLTQTKQKPKLLDTITASRKLMNGYKTNLLCLNLSFIGWHILASLTLGIGYLWLNPYISATVHLCN